MDEKEIGCFFLTPCPAKVTAIRNPIGHEKSAVDGAISVLDIYGPLSAALRKGSDGRAAENLFGFRRRLGPERRRM